MKYLLPVVLFATILSALETSFFSRDEFSIYDRDLLDSERDSHLSARAAYLSGYEGIHTRHADDNDDFQRQQLELQQKLQKAANDPEEAQKIQKQQLDLMKKQQDKMNGAENQKRQIERRSVHVRATAMQLQQQMITEQQVRDRAAIRKAAQQQADAIAQTPGAGVGAGATILKIIPGINARALLRRMAEALAEADDEG